MIKKEIKIDDYIKEIKNNKLEIISISLPNINPHETISVDISISREKEKEKENNKLNVENKKNNEMPNLFYKELKCNTKYKDLKHLIVINKNIIQINSYFYSNLKNLEVLDLSHNVIGKISEKITEFQSLKILNLNDNFLSVLPPYLKDLKSLEELYLNNNKIELIPTSIEFFPSLKILDLSQNSIERLPMELGFIAKLESLSIDRNDFTEIPTTLCFLENLRQMSLEWFEFLDPDLPKDQNDKNVIDSLKDFLKNKFMNSIMHIDFNMFLIKMSSNIQKKLDEENLNIFEIDENNLEEKKGYDFKFRDIFYAFNNNYFGVIKALVNDNKDLIKTRDSYSGKNLLYLSIHQNKKKLYDFLLSKTNISSISNNSSILFRAIRSRNFELFLKLVKLGYPLNVKDLKGNNVYHALFSVFNKNYEQCVQIGNYLLENNVPGYNAYNKDGWAPIHIAAKYSSYICLEWISHANQILSRENKEIFQINLLGKNNYTAFHLTCYTFKYSECMCLLNLGSNLLIRATDGKLPKNTTYNFFLTKMLFKKEQELFYDKYILNKMHKNFNNTSNNKIGLLSSKSFSHKPKILFTFDNHYDVKCHNKLTFINSERSKSEIICNNERYSLLEKYQILMSINLSNNKREICLRIKEIFKDISFKYSKNHIIIYDLLNIIQNYNLYEFFIDLKKYRNNSDNKNIFLRREINNVLLYLEKNKHSNLGAPSENLIIKSNNNNINKNKYNKSVQLMKNNKYLNKTESDIKNYLGNSNEINKIQMNNEYKKLFGVPGFQKIKEKKVQESITSIDFEDN